MTVFIAAGQAAVAFSIFTFTGEEINEKVRELFLRRIHTVFVKMGDALLSVKGLFGCQ